MSTILEKELSIGLKDFRATVSDKFDLAINHNKIFTIKNMKKDGEPAVFLSQKNFNLILSKFEFNTSLTFDKGTNQWEVINTQIQATGQGDTKEEAIEIFLDNVIMLTEDYMENLDLYLKIESTKQQFPYYLMLSYVIEDQNRLIEVLKID